MFKFCLTCATEEHLFWSTVMGQGLDLHFQASANDIPFTARPKKSSQGACLLPLLPAQKLAFAGALHGFLTSQLFGRSADEGSRATAGNRRSATVATWGERWRSLRGFIDSWLRTIWIVRTLDKFCIFDDQSIYIVRFSWTLRVSTMHVWLPTSTPTHDPISASLYGHVWGCCVFPGISISFWVFTFYIQPTCLHL